MIAVMMVFMIFYMLWKVYFPHSLCFSAVFLSDLERCEPSWDKFHGFCYRHFGQRLSWEVAEQHCRMLGAHLVSIMTPEEQSYINSRSHCSRRTGNSLLEPVCVNFLWLCKN